MTYELSARHDSRQSFSGKAQVKVNEHGDKILTSYGTEVAAIADGRVRVHNTYSTTTLRHIKEFLVQNGFVAESKQQIMEDYGVKK